LSISDGDDEPALLETDETVRRYPLLADVFAMDRPPAVVTQSLAEDELWIGIAVTAEKSDTKPGAFCDGKSW
jgi:hypothetical protein